MTQQRGDVVKLFVGQIPKTLEEDGVREVFQEFGEISEIVILRDRRTGMHQGCCFVKYTSLTAAHNAMQALHNQRSLPPLRNPLQVRLADSGGNTGDRGQTNAENKLFVGGVPTGCGDKDLRALFSTYGEVLDVYILASKASQEGQRGCAFVRYASPQSCAVAIEALHGKYAMRAGELPLVVRFADPPKNQRGNGTAGFGANGANGRFNWPSGAAPLWPSGPPPAGWSLPWALSSMAPWMISPGVMPPGMTPPSGAGPFAQFPFGAQQGQNQFLAQQQQQLSGGTPPPPPPNDNPAPTGGVPPPLPPQPAPASQTWSEHQTPEGLKYYYNSSTGTSSWDCPPELRSSTPVPPSSNGVSSLNSANNAASLVSAIAALGIGSTHQMPSFNHLGTSTGNSNSSHLTSSLTSNSNGFHSGSSFQGVIGGSMGHSNGTNGSLDSFNLPGLGALNGATGSSSVVMVHELPPKVSSQELQALFGQYGKITFCETNEGTNSGRVGFESPVSAAHAISVLNGFKLPGDKKLLVVPASGLAASIY
ncbi:hypothetical protein AB1Y20_015925 [Prymnesium parvum]|uniref:Uncharacterized protein n=1 Tax=Prymnesium parvum TaxID=97485 RepID=A0AB34JY43_PRYPA|mmetsp:Transcript_14878/g.37099  ORF Transcript_14878/g.37099 Transcript_14878/m.37099 type:complete len:535 (-) Transcript_14878:863-2467(-)|eukprot:CAMPEP_0182826336 /NCGR_PEP_ID=MMETSP0006_2-20121128/16323_1 /TAXON_ID=97485 /ORGANISM="Prymnesium parvum, Strain Texoma1" /LENGTH=534 /DNA_ID=CAMNT_0024953501 /DNA_START=90 /DNA_END=1694 /DNA_ORIENTATION=-